MTTDDLVDEAIRRLFSGEGNCGTLLDAVCNKDKLYFRIALAPVFAGLQDDLNEFKRQRNEALARLCTVQPQDPLAVPPA